MKLLLDTHIWVWSLLDPSRLSARVRRALQNESNELWLSPISTWEVLVLAEKGRLSVEPDAARWVRRAWDAAPFHEATLNREVAIESRRIALSHEDPADRFLAATAVVYELTLVTADARLRRLKTPAVLPNA
ncbi:MAG: type II toxin-antitoxin system VapC family toxin [Polyangiales bacterium]